MTFDETLKAATAALAVLGTGRLRTVLVREGARAYEVGSIPPRRPSTDGQGAGVSTDATSIWE